MSLRFITAEEAAALIHHDDQVGFSGFTHSGCPKVVPRELAMRAEREHASGREFKIGVFTGASTGDSIDGCLSRAGAVKFRTPYQSNRDMRQGINNGGISYLDLHLSALAQDLRYGFYGEIDVAIIEACDITDEGEIIPTCGVGITPTIARMAKKVIVEWNTWHPKELRGIHDLMEPDDPPVRKPIPLCRSDDRIGREGIKVDLAKLWIVKTNEANEGSGFAPVNEVTLKIAGNAVHFFIQEIKAGRIPASFLPIQSGVGNVANAVLEAMGGDDRIPEFHVFTEVIQDSVISLMESGKVSFASGGTLTVSNECLDRIYRNLDFYKKRIVLRPSEISNHPELVRRLGIIAMNTALEVDIYGNVNSTHVLGCQMMNGIGGSGDFARNAYLSLFLTPSVAKGGDISAFVPMVSHEDHSEHSVKVIISEYGVADLRGKSPRQRAECIIGNCVHPEYRELLEQYLSSTGKGQTPVNLENAFAFHRAYGETGSMKNAGMFL